MEIFKTEKDVVGGVAAAAARLSAWTDGNMAHWRPHTAHTQQYVSHNFYSCFLCDCSDFASHENWKEYVWRVDKRAPKSLFNIVRSHFEKQLHFSLQLHFLV